MTEAERLAGIVYVECPGCLSTGAILTFERPGTGTRSFFCPHCLRVWQAERVFPQVREAAT
jgi:hypothetical protein